MLHVELLPSPTAFSISDAQDALSQYDDLKDELIHHSLIMLLFLHDYQYQYDWLKGRPMLCYGIY